MLEKRQVNDVDHLARTLPDDLGRCVTTLLTPLRSHFSEAEFNGLVQRKTTVLQLHDVNTKGDLIGVLRTISGSSIVALQRASAWRHQRIRRCARLLNIIPFSVEYVAAIGVL